MATYKLEEETPNTFISPIFLGNRFVYRMIRFHAELSYTFIRDIDLRKDRLIVHGTVIEEPKLEMLYDCLRLRPNAGRVYVNCDGACYIVVESKGVYRPIDNVIFDWSRFGVIIPNSVNDVFRKQLEEKDQALESSKEEAKERVSELEEQLICCKKESEDMKTKVRDLEEQHCLVEAELQSTKMELESSKKNIREVEDRLSSCSKEKEDNGKELEKVRNELLDGKIELELNKTKLESYYKKMEQLEEELATCKKESQDKDAKLHSLRMNELQSMKVLLEFTNDKEKEDTWLSECYVIKVIEIVEDVIVN